MISKSTPASCVATTNKSKVPYESNNQSVLLEPTTSLPNISLACTKCLSKVKNDTAVMQVMNTSDRPVSIPSSFVVANVCTVSEELST